ncbi:Transcription factor bHLH133 [Zea mays]|nr:Transcription factor bHLH133 [Zea mays]
MVGGGGGVEEEGSAAMPLYSLYGGGSHSHSHLAAAGDHEMPPAPAAAAAGANKSQLSQMLLASSPRSCVTTSLGSNMLDFSNNGVPPAPDQLKSHHHHQSDNSSECNSTVTGSAIKKPRVQASSSAQSTLKVRKERLGDRITALHQIVSPFGKTDTASVLQETIGYIRFLLGQIEALSYPYMGHGNGTSIQNGPTTGERNHAGLLPDQYPGQLLNHNNNTGARQPAAVGQPDEQQQQQGGANNNDETKKDLRSRGLCLVPVSCTSHFGGDNAADYWAPAPLGGILR